MMVWLPSSNCFGQFTAVDATPDQEHSILVRGGEQLDAVEPHLSGSSPKPYSAVKQVSDTSNAQANTATDVANDFEGGGFISSNSQPAQVDRHDSQTTGLSSNGLRGASRKKFLHFQRSAAPAHLSKSELKVT